MRAWDIVRLNPDRTHLIESTAIETCALVEHAAAHCLSLYIVEVACDHAEPLFVFLLLFWKGIDISLLNSLECSLALVLVLVARLGDVVAALVALGLDVGTELLVIDLVAIFHDWLANSLHEFLLYETVNLDGIVSSLECAKQILLAHLIHLTLDHHDVLVGSTNHKVHVGLFHLLESRVDDIFAIDANHANLRDWTLERNTAHSHCSRSSKSGKCVWLVFFIRRI